MIKIITVGIEKFELDEVEFKKLEKLISEKKKGLVKLSSGEYINLESINAIKNKKQWV